MSRSRLGYLIGVLVSLLIVLALGCPRPKEEKKASDAPRYAPIPKEWVETSVDVFPGMNGFTLDPGKPDEKEALRGRIVWNLWVGDSGLMWDFLARNGFGTADLLKTIDSRLRPTRFQVIGLINQPGFMQAPKPDEYGLFIDVPRPGDPDGEIDSKIDFTTYGRSSGVVGLRVSNNPEFKDAAKDAWMERVRAGGGVNKDFYETPDYYNDPKLVRPYLVGMACAVCHVSFDPVRPPANIAEPKWENLNDYIGAQYFRVAEVFVPRRLTGGYNGQPLTVGPKEEASFIWQLINSNPPGTLDTSFIATDYLNNPVTMNAVFNIAQRVSRGAKGVSKDPGAADPMVEYITGGALDLKWLTLDNGQLVPRVLKQGDDSIGIEGALSRVYVNIGHAWPEWQKHFRPLIGGPFLKNPDLASQSPVTVKAMQMTSPSWNWSEDRSEALKKYFVAYARPRLLKDAPDGAKYLTTDQKVLDRGKIVFAENCARCHSSKQPPGDPASAEGTSWFKAEVMKPDFFTDNFLGDERRHKVTDIGTNSARAAATNATRNHIWDNFSSETYKNLPPIGKFMVDNPYAQGGKSEVSIPLPGEPNGPGYYRPPSLISLWSSAPFLHNNAVGADPQALTPGDVSVGARIKAFNDGIEKMLFVTQPGKQPRGKLVWTTSQRSYINIPLAYLPDEIQKGIKLASIRHKDLVDQKTQSVKIGPIPKGTPINLLTNTNLDLGLDLAAKRIELYVALVDALIKIKADKLNETQAEQLMAARVMPKFLAVNKCPDFYEDKGHEFGRQLPPDDKKALIELLKTF